MNEYIKQTELWEIQPNGKRYRMNIISYGSKFHGFKTPDRMDTADGQLEAARELKLGWVLNGPHRGVYKYEIVQVWSSGRTCVVA